MKTFKELSDLEYRIIRTEFGKLLKSNIITGINNYKELINYRKPTITISLLHRDKYLKEQFLSDIRDNNITRPLISIERKKEVKLIRKKESIYIAKPNFIVQRDIYTGKLNNEVIYFDFLTRNRIPNKILNKANTINDINNFGYKEIGIREINGYEINLNIKYKEEAKEVLNLLRRRFYKFKINKMGLIIYSSDGKKIINLKSYHSADRIPCIILGQGIENIIREKLEDFSLCQKLILIKGKEEISTLTHETTEKLREHSSYSKLKKLFGQQLKEVSVFANNLFVKYTDELSKI